MNLIVKQISGLEKIKPDGIGDLKTIKRKTLLGGERFSYQIAIQTVNPFDNFGNTRCEFKIEVISPLKEHVNVYFVKNAIMDMAAYETSDEDYITKLPGIMPDILMPMERESGILRLSNEAGAIWIDVRIPENTQEGEYPVTIQLSSKPTDEEEIIIKKTVHLDVIPANIPKQSTIYTQWLHADCIAEYHNVPIYSEEHWTLIDKYMALAADIGVNMMLTPVITPPLDTERGTARPCVQLVKIEKKGDKYVFDFSLLKRWISLCEKNSIKYFEISHLFSQGGLAYSPNIKVMQNGVEEYMFGWHVSAQSESYRDFLMQFIPALIAFLKEEGIKERCWFHVSDEPTLEHLSAYKYAYEIIKPLIEDCRTFDAMSDYEFVKTGLIQTPVTAIDHIEPFLKNKTEHQWGYYCCGQFEKVSNRFLSMPSYRNRIIGLQIYKYNLEGFLHWGLNFYFSQASVKKINPYITSSGDKWLPSGDAFSVYPVKDGAVPSLRALVFREALCDVEICRMLESFIGRNKVIKMIDEEAAGMSVTFSQYPRNSEYIPNLIDKMKTVIKSYLDK